MDQQQKASGMTNKHSIFKALNLLYSARSETDPFDGAANRMDKKGNFGLWLEDAWDEKRWEWLILSQLRKPHLKFNEPETSSSGSNQNESHTNNNRAPSPRPSSNAALPQVQIMAVTSEPLSNALVYHLMQLKEKQKSSLEVCAVYIIQINTTQHTLDLPTPKQKPSSNCLTTPTNL
ncbi:hypothetical protein ACHAXN_008709 [Cyclotella atomus]